MSAAGQPQRPRIRAGIHWNQWRPLRPTCCGWCSAHPAALRIKSSRCSSVSCPRHGVRARRVGQASLPASWRGIPAPCCQFGGGGRPWKRAAGMPPELAGKDACPTAPARVAPQVSSSPAPVPAGGCRKLSRNYAVEPNLLEHRDTIDTERRSRSRRSAAVPAAAPTPERGLWKYVARSRVRSCCGRDARAPESSRAARNSARGIYAASACEVRAGSDPRRRSNGEAA